MPEKRPLRARGNSTIRLIPIFSPFNPRTHMTTRIISKLCFVAGLILLATAVLSDTGWARSRQPVDGTLQQRKDCADDARMVCGRFIPDVARITQCMTANKRQLSPQCRRHFR